MSETFEGAHATNDEAEFEDISDPSFYDEEGDGEQLYLDSVLPHAFDPTCILCHLHGCHQMMY